MHHTVGWFPLVIFFHFTWTFMYTNAVLLCCCLIHATGFEMLFLAAWIVRWIPNYAWNGEGTFAVNINTSQAQCLSWYLFIFQIVLFYAWYAWFEWMMQIIDFLSKRKLFCLFELQSFLCLAYTQYIAHNVIWYNNTNSFIIDELIWALNYIRSN